MAARDIPSFLKKKKLLDHVDLPAAECGRYGRLFLAAGALADALDFFLKGNDTEGLDQLRDLAVDTGDAFLLERLGQAQGLDTPELWEKVAIKAAALEKFTLARWAEERLAQSAFPPATGGRAAPDPHRPPNSDHADPA